MSIHTKTKSKTRGKYMKKMTTLALSAVMGLAVMTTSASACAKADKGQRTYQNKMVIECGMNSEQFAAKHTQAEWTAIQLRGDMEKEAGTICKSPISLTEKEAENLFQYSRIWAKDSGKVTVEIG